MVACWSSLKVFWQYLTTSDVFPTRPSPSSTTLYLRVGLGAVVPDVDAMVLGEVGGNASVESRDDGTKTERRGRRRRRGAGGRRTKWGEQKPTKPQSINPTSTYLPPIPRTPFCSLSVMDAERAPVLAQGNNDDEEEDDEEHEQEDMLVDELRQPEHNQADALKTNSALLPPQPDSCYSHGEGMAMLQAAMERVPPEDVQWLVSCLPRMVPTVPDELTQFLTKRAGLVADNASTSKLNEVAMTRLISLAGQMVVEQAIHEATKLAERRHRGGTPKDLHRLGYSARQTARLEGIQLRTDDVSDALVELGVDFRPRPFYADTKASDARSDAYEESRPAANQ